jgi:hypothetical protein
MLFLDKWERKFGWLSFPGLLKYYALFHVLVYLLQIVNPGIGVILEFDRAKIMNGEVWRVVTFLVADSGFRGLGAFGALFLFFMVMIAFLMNDSLEGAWGAFRTSVFHYTAFAGLLIANFLYPVPMPGSGFFVYTSAFFAFATLFPRHEFLMFLIIPVQVRWLAILLGGLLVFGTLADPLYFGFLLLGFANYLLWAGIPAMRGQARVVKSVARKRKFDKNKLDDGEAFHRCKSCGRTEVSDPELEFRMAADGEEYCGDHLGA